MAPPKKAKSVGRKSSTDSSNASTKPALDTDHPHIKPVFRSGTRPPHDEIIQYVDTFKDHFGVEAICRTLRATECGFLITHGYWAAKTRPVSARALRDELLGAEIIRLHSENYGV